MFVRNVLFADILIKTLRKVKTHPVSSKSSAQVKPYSSFHEWTLDYFRRQPQFNEFVLRPSVVDLNAFNNNSFQLKTIPTDELLIIFSCKNNKFSHFEIDRELVNRVNNMSINHILALMDACLNEKKQFLKNSRSFKKCMEVLDEWWFRRPDLTASQTLQLMYYVSTYKNKSKPTVEFGLKRLTNDINYLKQLSDEELSVLAVATYKSSAKVYDKMLKIFAYRVENNLDKLIENPLLFISLIKPLKKAKYHDPILLKHLVTTLNNNNNNKVFKDLTSSIHLLTYFADANYGDVEFLQQLIDTIGNCMIKDNLKYYRIKDVSNYVFSVSYLGLTPKDTNVCKIINNFLSDVFDTKEKCKKMSRALIGMCLSMWMLDYKPIKLMTFIFSEVSVAALRMPNAHKQDNRLNLLLTCAVIEQPELIMRNQLVDEKSVDMPDAYKHLGERPFLVKVFHTLQKLSHKLDISNVEYNFSIPHLKILGIKLIKNNSNIIYVEVLDSSTCLYNTEIPNGMMKLKFRLEKKLNFNFIIINHKENVLHNPISLEHHLESVLSSI